MDVSFGDTFPFFIIFLFNQEEFLIKSTTAVATVEYIDVLHDLMREAICNERSDLKVMHPSRFPQ